MNKSATQRNAILFQHSFFEMLEELKMRRTLTAQNEKRIRQVVEQHHQMEKEKADLSREYQLMMERHEEELQLLRQQNEDKVQSLEDQMVVLSLSVESKQKEITALKEGLESLRQDKYEVERINAELSQSLQIQSSCKEPLVNKMTDIEEKLLHVNEVKLDVQKQLTKLQENVDSAVALNQKLHFLHEQHDDEVTTLRRELSAKCAQIVRSRETEMKTTDDGADARDAVEKELALQKEVARRLTDQIESMTDDRKKMEKLLRDAHEIIEKSLVGKEKTKNEVAEEIVEIPTAEE